MYAKAQIYRGTGYIIYDPNNLPVSMYLTNGQNLVYKNDANGSRVRNTIAGNSDNFYYNGADGKTEAVALAAYDSNMVYNIINDDGKNIGQVKVAKKTTKRYYYLKDPQGGASALGQREDDGGYHGDGGWL